MRVSSSEMVWATEKERKSTLNSVVKRNLMNWRNVSNVSLGNIKTDMVRTYFTKTVPAFTGGILVMQLTYKV